MGLPHYLFSFFLTIFFSMLSSREQKLFSLVVKAGAKADPFLACPACGQRGTYLVGGYS